MEKRLEKLLEWGCDVDGALARMLGDEDFYLNCLALVVAEDDYLVLKKCLQAQDVEGAFGASHNLKGVLSNLGLTPMCATNAEILEPLRKGSAENLLPIMEELLKQREYLASLIKQ